MGREDVAMFTHTHHTDTYLLFWLKVERLLTARQCLCGYGRGGEQAVSWGWLGDSGEKGRGRRGRNEGISS